MDMARVCTALGLRYLVDFISPSCCPHGFGIRRHAWIQLFCVGIYSFRICFCILLTLFMGLNYFLVFPFMFYLGWNIIILLAVSHIFGLWSVLICSSPCFLSSFFFPSSCSLVVLLWPSQLLVHFIFSFGFGQICGFPIFFFLNLFLFFMLTHSFPASSSLFSQFLLGEM